LFTLAPFNRYGNSKEEYELMRRRQEFRVEMQSETFEGYINQSDIYTAQYNLFDESYVGDSTFR